MLSATAGGIGFFLLFLAITEGVAFLGFRYPAGTAMLRATRLYYLSSVRRNVQYLPECARYDPEVTYTLRPGGCRYRSLEYAVELRTNHLGLPDDERSLDNPEVIVVGDSHAMGWGVSPGEAFADVLERRTGYRTLNMGTPSFGTAREMILLRRVDRSAMRYLLVQHCGNDYEENLTFHEHDGTLPILSSRAYLDIRERYLAGRSYYPAKYTLGYLPLLLRMIWKDLAGVYPPGNADPWPRSRDFEAEARALLYAVLHSGVDLSRATIVIFEIAGYNRDTSRFHDALRTELARAREAGPLPRILPLDLAPVLGPEHYYPIDGHMNARGHRAVAGELARLLDPAAVARQLD